MDHSSKEIQKVHTSAHDETASKITIGEPTLLRRAGARKPVPKIRSTKPNTSGRSNGRNQNAPTLNSTPSPGTTQDPNTGQGPNRR